MIPNTEKRKLEEPLTKSRNEADEKKGRGGGEMWRTKEWRVGGAEGGRGAGSASCRGAALFRENYPRTCR